MSEEISSGATKETSSNITNNNNNNSNNNNNNKLTKQNSEHNASDYDEIGEEFNFSDSDLDEEFEDCDSNARSNNADNDGLTAATTSTTTTTSTATAAEHLDSTQNTLCGESSELPVPKTSLDDVIVENVSKTKNPKSVNENSNVELLPAATTAAAQNAQTNNKNDDDDAIDKYDDDDDYYSDEPEDELIVQFLGEANRIAEARLTARKLARTEAREIRMRELERQQKEQEQNGDRAFDKHSSPALESITRARHGIMNSVTSRRSSEDSLDEEGRGFRDTKQELKDAEERFRKAMIANAQMDNERASQAYQIEHLKDQLEELSESHMQVQRELKDKSRDCNALQRNVDKLNEELKLVQGQLSERDALIAEQGLVVVAVENEDGSDAKRTLITAENAQLLSSVQGSLDVRLKRFNEEKQNLREEIQHLRTQLEHYKSKDIEAANRRNNQLSEEEFEAQREANKLLSDYKFRLQKAEQDIASLQANLARSESQLIRYKSAAEAAEKAEAELKGDRRKLQRENREALERLEELETSNKHLLKRLDKLKNAKSALLKEL